MYATEMKPIRRTFPACCASTASGAMRRLRVSITMHPTALYHMVVSFGLMPTCFFPWKPNARCQPPLEAVGCTPWFGLAVGIPLRHSATRSLPLPVFIRFQAGVHGKVGRCWYAQFLPNLYGPTAPCVQLKRPASVEVLQE